MKSLRRIFLLLIILSHGAMLATEMVQQRIRFYNREATEVYMVWGLDNWQMPAAAMQPQGSFIKDNLVYTLMEAKDHNFETTLSIPAGATVDCVFWITKGIRNVGTDVWDTNKPSKDYHTVAFHNGILQVESTVPARPEGQPSVIDFAWYLLMGIVLAFILSWRFRRKRADNSAPASLVTIASASVSLLVFLVMIRPSVVGIGWDLYISPLANIPKLLATSYYDLLFALFVFLCGSAIIAVSWKLPRLRQLFSGFFVAFVVLSLISALVNIRVIALLGKPFNYQWFYYSDFLKSADARAAISANIDVSYITRFCAVLISFFLLFLMLRQLLASYWHIFRLKRVGVTCSLVLAAYIFSARNSVQTSQYKYDKLANSVTAFLESVNPFAPAPALFTMEVPDSLRYSMIGQEPAPIVVEDKVRKQMKNLLVFVLESTPWEYVDVYGSKYNATPNLKKYSEHALIFNNIYAHAPATNLSMVSLLSSVYPWLSYNSLTEEHPDIKVPSITSELKRSGYRTGFFNSADNRFQKAGEFLKHRGFERITDCTSESCKESLITVQSDWDYMNGKSDACTSQELMDWIGNDSKPFFAMMWTYQTHYPYFPPPSRQNFEPHDTLLNRYLNALHEADQVFGNLMTRLEASGRMDSTLVLVIGDHGEAFGRHDQITHGRKIYEENLHVPCMIINPSLWKAKIETVGGMVDVAPTLMQLLGKKKPAAWQGTDLLAGGQGRTFFFAPWSDYLFGFREGNYKYIFNASTNTTEIYDLAKDQTEQSDLSSAMTDRVPYAHFRLAGWAQFVNDKMERLIAKGQTTVKR